MNIGELDLLSKLLTIVLAGVSSYVGVKVAIAEIRGDIKRHDEKLSEHDDRLDRLEAGYFKK